MLLQTPLLILISSIIVGINVLAFPLHTINSEFSSSRNENTQPSTYESSVGSSLASRVLNHLLLSSTLSSTLPKQPSLPHFRRAVPGDPIDPTAQAKVPSVEDIEKQLNFPPNTALFWSGDREAAAAYAQANGLKTMDMAISGPTPWNTDWLKEPSIKNEYWDRASTAMVNVISGTVHVMLRGGKNDPITHRGTVWANMEWPPLEKGSNPKVVKIIRVNPQGKEVGQIWPAPPA